MDEYFETMGDYLDKYNPLAIKDSKNRILHFKTYDDCYLYVLKETRRYCKRGYCDVALLVKHLTGFDEDTCEEVALAAKKETPELAEQPLLLDWTQPDKCTRKLAGVINGMHILTETDFNQYSFEYAYLMFKQFNDRYNAEEND